MPDQALKIISVIDPMLCTQCNFARVAEVLFTDGTTREMFYCARLDCDNWCRTGEISEDRKAA